MSVHTGASGLPGGMIGSSTHLQMGAALNSWSDSNRQHADTMDAMESYFECITTCSLEDGECVTRCVEQLRERA